jgi:hypothetical protein
LVVLQCHAAIPLGGDPLLTAPVNKKPAARPSQGDKTNVAARRASALKNKAVVTESKHYHYLKVPGRQFDSP